MEITASDREEYLSGFLAEGTDWAEKFIEFAVEVKGTSSLQTLVNEIFRGVHNVKGNAGFLGDVDERFERLLKYCHAFETYLDHIRKGEVEDTPQLRNLVAEGLNALRGDIEALTRNENIESHDNLLDKFKDASNPIVSVKTYDHMIILRLNRNLYAMEDVEYLTKLAWEHAHRVGPDAVMVFDLAGQYRLCSAAIGMIIGIASSVYEIYVLQPPRFMELVFKRFRHSEMGIQIAKTLEECKVR